MSKTGVIPLLLNYFFCVGVVLLNKSVTKEWPFSTTLTAFHFLFTFICLLILCLSGVFKHKKLSILGVLPLALSFAASIVLNNLSIQLNQVSFYQTMKIAVTPCVCVIEMLFYKKRFPITVLLSIVTIIVGVGLCTGASLQTEPLGFIVGAAGAVSTALYQIWSKTTQKKLDCNEFQLLLYETPMAAVLVAVIAYFTENYNLSSPTSIWNQHYTPILITKIICTAIGSVGINITLFVGINRTSPLTYNVVSHLKTISIIVLGTILFQEQLTSKRLIGMVVAIGGIVLYSVSNKPQSGGQKQERNSPSPTKTRPKRPDEDDKDTVRIRRAAKSSRTPTRK